MTRGLAANADEVAKVVAEKASSMALARRVRRLNVILVSSFLLEYHHSRMPDGRFFMNPW
jgi:hypothetical protein